MLDKAAGIAADELVLDLEDAVAIDAKEAARGQVVEALEVVLAGHGNLAVRVNPVRSRWCHADLLALVDAGRTPSSVVIPKVESAGDLAFVDRLLDGAERAAGVECPIRIQALIESAAGLLRIAEIAAASPRLDALVLGYADLAASLGRSDAGLAGLDGWRPVQEAVLTVARSFGVDAIDGPHLGVRVDAEFRAAAQRARNLGFDGKWAIHPSQVKALNEAFTPTGPELEQAHLVIDTLAQATAGAVTLNGEMLDEAVRARASRTVAKGGPRR